MDIPTLLLSPAEPSSFKKLFADAMESSLCETRGADIMTIIKRPPNVISLGIQRKKVPEDFVASVGDGRLQKELAQMKENFTVGVLVLEGPFLYDSSGKLRSPSLRHPYHFTKTGIRNLLRSVSFQFGVHVEFTENHQDTHDAVIELVKYFMQSKHRSLFSRPTVQGEWGEPTPSESALFWIQGFSGISSSRGETLLRHFPDPLSLCIAPLVELQKVKGIGKKTATRIYDFLRTSPYKTRL